MPSAFRPTSATAYPWRHRDDGADHREGLFERADPSCRVVRVHQRVAAGLDLGDTGVLVEVERAGAAGGDDVAADEPRAPRQRHRRLDLAACFARSVTIIRWPS
jgi:hypothetical protein